MTDQLLSDLILEFQTFRTDFSVAVQWIVGLHVALFAVLLLILISQYLSQYKG